MLALGIDLKRKKAKQFRADGRMSDCLFTPSHLGARNLVEGQEPSGNCVGLSPL